MTAIKGFLTLVGCAVVLNAQAVEPARFYIVGNDSHTRFTYQPTGQLTGIELDWDLDGKIDYVARLEYDKAGNLICKKVDANNDGIFERTQDCRERLPHFEKE